MAYNINTLAPHQQEVQRLHDRYYRKVSETMTSWAIKKATELKFVPSGYSKKVQNKRWCPFCGETVEVGTRKCPHCGASLGVASEKFYINFRHTFKDSFLFEEITTCHGWQISRIWLADFTFHKGHPYELSYLGSLFERWFNPTIGKEVLLGKYRGMYPYMRRIPWALSCFDNTEAYVHHTLQLRSYTERPDLQYPHVRLLDWYKKRNFSKVYALSNGDASKVFRLFLDKKNNTIFETILKVGNDDEIQLMLNFPDEHIKYWRTILVSRRHHFDYATHRGEYFDYLRQLEDLHLDLRSPHYVAPADFRAMHQTMTGRLNAIAERQRKEKLRQWEIQQFEREKKQEKSFIKARERYFGLALVSNAYKAEPLKSIKEFLEEGLAMDHCVFSAGYYDMNRHPDSLILSVKNKETEEREVTIEINTKTWKIQQSYAKHDNIHPDDKEIRKWICANMDTIRKFSKVSHKTAVSAS